MVKGQNGTGRVAAIMVGVCAAVSVAVADGFRNPPDTASTLGRIGGRIAQVDDAAAAFYNPANMVDLARPSVMVSALVGYNHADYSSAWGGATDTEDPWKALPSLYVVWPGGDGQYSLGFAANLPFGRSTEWDKAGYFRYSTPYYAELSVYEFSPSFACDLGGGVSLGVGLDIYYSSLDFRQVVPWSLALGIPAPDGEMKAAGNGTGFGVNAGLTWRMTSSQRVALTYRSPFDIQYDGDLTIEDIPAGAAGMVASTSDFETKFKFPTIVGLGYGVQLTKTVRVEADVEWLQFSRFDSLDVDAGVNNALLASAGLSTMRQNWDDTWTFGVGGDWKFAPDWVLRAGYIYLQSPAPNETFMPTMLDVNQSVVSVGLGYKHGPHAVDVAYALGIFDDRSISDNANTAYNGDYEFEGHLAALSYSYWF